MRTSFTTHKHYRGGLIMMAIAVCAYYVLNWLSPEYHDDFVYKFMVVGGSVDFSRPIRNLGDIFLSQVDHYTGVNGRSIVHFLVQLFTGLLGKQVFNIFNAIFFAAFVWLLKRNATPKAGSDTNPLAIAITLTLILLMPRFKDTFLWMTGSINYLWSATGTLLFLLIYEKQRCQALSRSLFWLLPIAFLLGWTHEGITLPLALSLVCVNLLRIKSIHHRQGLWLALAFLGGACMIVLSPGTIARSGAHGGLSASTIGLKMITGFIVMGKLKVVYLAVLLTVVALFMKPDETQAVVSGNKHLLLAVLLSCGIVFFSGLDSTRTAFGLELFSTIYLLRLVGGFVEDFSTRAIGWSFWIMSMGLAVFYVLLLNHTIASWQESQRLIAQITHTRDGIIGTREHHAGVFSSHICTMLSPDSTVNAVNYDPKGWPASIAATYHCDSLVFLPQAFLDDLKEHSDKYEQLDFDTSLEFFVQHIGKNEEINEIRYLLLPFDFSSLPFFFRPIAMKMKRYNQSSVATTKWATVTLYGKRYLIIKRDHDYDNRLLDIQIIHNNKEEQPT